MDMTLEQSLCLVRGFMHQHPKGIAVRDAWEEIDVHLAQHAAIAEELDDYKNASLHSADDLRRKDAEIAKYAAMMEWKPIETAPMDGTRILVVTNSGHVFTALNNNPDSLSPWRQDGTIFHYHKNDIRRWKPLPLAA